MFPSVVLLLPGSSYRADDFFQAARRLSAAVIVASDRCHELALLWPAAGQDGPGLRPAQTLPLVFRDPGEAARALVDQLGAVRPAAIIGVDDQTAVIAARASALLGLPHNPVASVEAARDKALSRQRLREAGVPVPWFEVVQRELDAAALEALCGRSRFPCVVKPLTLSASRGVIRADDASQLKVAIARVAQLLRSPQVAERRDPALLRLLVEEFLPGPEVALEGMLRAGELETLALFDKPDALEGPFFEETLYVTPSRHPDELQRQTALMAQRAARALGLREGPVHAELRLTPEGPRVLEVAARSIGGLCSRTLRFGVGSTLEELILRHALGQPAPAQEREAQAAGVVMLPIPRRGILREVRGVLAARAVPGIEDVVITARLDAELVPLPEGSAYLGFAFARAATPDAVERALRAAQAALSFTVLPALPLAAAAALAPA